MLSIAEMKYTDAELTELDKKIQKRIFFADQFVVDFSLFSIMSVWLPLLGKFFGY